jgi:hypothetical protein
MLPAENKEQKEQRAKNKDICSTRERGMWVTTLRVKACVEILAGEIFPINECDIALSCYWCTLNGPTKV